MSKKILITVWNDDITPRFDLTSEVVVATIGDDGSIKDNKNIVLAHESAEELCQLILDSEIETVICGGIEEKFYEYLVWKKIEVFDSVMGPWESALENYGLGNLKAGSILYNSSERKPHA